MPAVVPKLALVYDRKAIYGKYEVLIQLVGLGEIMHHGNRENWCNRVNHIDP
jgi:hypothetical protein